MDFKTKRSVDLAGSIVAICLGAIGLISGIVMISLIFAILADGLIMYGLIMLMEIVLFVLTIVYGAITCKGKVDSDGRCLVEKNKIIPLIVFVAVNLLFNFIISIAVHTFVFVLIIILSIALIALKIVTLVAKCEGNPGTQETPVISNAAATAASTDAGCIYKVIGEVKDLSVYEDHVVITAKKNVRSLLTHNFFGGQKKIFYDSMIGVQFKPSSAMILGYIQVETANSSSKDNFNSENSVTFTHHKIPNEQAKAVVDFIENKIRQAKQPKVVVTQAPTSSADELGKYKSLLDQGVISQEEFDAKKKEILGL